MGENVKSGLLSTSVVEEIFRTVVKGVFLVVVLEVDGVGGGPVVMVDSSRLEYRTSIWY